MIPYTAHSLTEGDIQAVTDALRGKVITRGEIVKEFEDAIADYVGAKHAVAFNSGTTAIHTAMIASMMVKPDPVPAATTPLTFIGTVNAIVRTGRKVEYADIDKTLCMGKSDAEIVVPVHFAGYPMNIYKYKGIIIEDACHALGAKGAGNCKHSLMACFSFHPAKIITTGEGGMVTTNDARLDNRLREFRNNCDYGLNYNITDFQCALGLNQLNRIDEFLKRRREIAHRYNEAFFGWDLILPPNHENHAWHIYVLRSEKKDTIRENLRLKGYTTQVHYKPLKSMPNVDEYYRTAFTIPMFYGLGDEQVEEIITTIKESL